jgi:hypothetical protein
MFDTVSRAGVVWAPAALELPWWERAAPLRAALCWASVQPGQHFVHGGAVGGPAGGVLLAGRGGSGKSTLALACVEHGMGYAGDDYVLVTTSPGPVAHAVYRSAKVDPESLRLVPGMKGAVDDAPIRPGDKAVLHVGRHHPARAVDALPITAIVNPHVTGAARPTLHRVSPRDALVKLAPSTLYQLPGDAASALATMSAVARQVPSYVLEVGGDLRAAASVVAELAEGRP